MSISRRVNSKMQPDDFLQVARGICDPLFLLTAQGEILVANPAAYKMLAMDNSMTGKNLRELLSSDQADKIKQTLRNWSASRQPVPAILIIRREDGEYIKCHCHGNLLQPRAADNPALIMLHSREKSNLTGGFAALNEKINQLEGQIRQRIRAEQKIKQLNEDLEERVRERTLELQTANTHLQDSLQQLNETQAQLVQSEKMASLGGLVAGVAHEINTPVGVGVTAVSHLQMKLEQYAARYHSGQLTREDFESLLASAAESSNIISNNLVRAAELIGSFKQVAVDQSSNEPRSFKILEYLQEILQSLKPKLKQGAIDVQINCPEQLVMHSYPGALSQIMTNLVMNSLIHGFENRPDGHIRIGVTEVSPDSLRLHYSDDGKGIPAQHLRKVFEPFFTTRRGRGGSGLGMHIVFNLVTQTLGGKITCQSAAGRGASFQLDLPVSVDVEKTVSRRHHLVS